MHQNREKCVLAASIAEISDLITMLGMLTFKVECRRDILLKIQTIRLEINFIQSIHHEKPSKKTYKGKEFHMNVL